MKPLQAAVVVGAVSAAIAWLIAYSWLHEPNLRWTKGGELLWVSHTDDDAGLNACVWAAVAYVVTFTPTLLLLSRRVSRRALQKDHDSGLTKEDRA